VAQLGGLRALEAMPRRPCLIVLNYHRIANPDSCPYDRGVIDATPAQFDEQIGWLKRHYRITSLDEVCTLSTNPRELKRCLVLLSFDDGYRDGADVVLPILRSYGLRAVFFLPTALVGTSRVPWWDQIAFAIRRSTRDRICLRYPRDVEIPLSPGDRESAIRRVLRMYKEDATRDQGRFLAMVEDASGVELPKTAPERLFLDWSEAALLAREGMAVGSHSHSSELLAKGTAAQQLEECETSRDVLRSKLDLQPVAFAYPVGSRASFSPTTQHCLREAGYKVAFSYYGGVNTPRALQPFDLKRIPVDRDESMAEYRLRLALAAAMGTQIW
jgi:peptidoglycan/xylan/chitin deacetylase (PgdA/CDA1 family)